MATRHLLKLYKVTAVMVSPQLIGQYPLAAYGYATDQNDCTLHFYDWMQGVAKQVEINGKGVTDYELKDIVVKEVEYKEGMLT